MIHFIRSEMPTRSMGQELSTFGGQSFLARYCGVSCKVLQLFLEESKAVLARCYRFSCKVLQIFLQGTSAWKYCSFSCKVLQLFLQGILKLSLKGTAGLFARYTTASLARYYIFSCKVLKLFLQGTTAVSYCVHNWYLYLF